VRLYAVIPGDLNSGQLTSLSKTPFLGLDQNPKNSTNLQKIRQWCFWKAAERAPPDGIRHTAFAEMYPDSLIWDADHVKDWLEGGNIPHQNAGRIRK
jgi:hypothetical protein